MSHVKLNRQAIDDVSKIADLAERKAAIKAKVGTLDGVDVLFNRILVATYVRSNMTRGGIILTGNNLEEDVWQGKVGLVLKVGPDAFKDDDSFSFYGQSADIGEWIVFKPGDGYQVGIGDWPCRMVRDTAVLMKVKNPAIIDKD